MDCFFFYYRSWGALLDGNVVANTTAENALRTPGLTTTTKKRRTASNGNSSPPASTAKVKAALQSLLTDLEIEHYDLVRGKKSAADKLLAVHAVHPNVVDPFVTLLNKLNQRGPSVNLLAERLTPLTLFTGNCSRTQRISKQYLVASKDPVAAHTPWNVLQRLPPQQQVSILRHIGCLGAPGAAAAATANKVKSHPNGSLLLLLQVEPLAGRHHAKGDVGKDLGPYLDNCI